jgi:group I intron endonuclease
MGYIYKITNTINNKCYIGQTKQIKPEYRWNDHIASMKTGRKGCPLLMASAKKYGIECFKFEIIIICFDNDLDKYEVEYIKKYNSLVPNGYNITYGGHINNSFKNKKHTEETKQKLRLKAIEYNKSEEVRERARQGAILFNKTHNIAELQRKSEKWQKALREGRIGGGQSEEVKNKIREGVKRYYENNCSPINREKHSQLMTKINGRKVNQYDKDKVFIASYDSIILASKASGVERRNIQANMARRSKSAGGYIWEYADKELKA